MRKSLAAAVAALAVMAPPAPAKAGYSGLTWETCAENKAAQCATLEVPVDWAAPGNGTLKLKVVKRPAAGDAGDLGVLLTDWGGPSGTSGTLLADDTVYGKLSPAVRARFDAVAIDGREGLVECEGQLEPRHDDSAPAGLSEFEEDGRRNRQFLESCTPRGLVGNVDSMSIARDWDALREALGQQRISFYGVSYGTVTGQSYARLFPGRVRAMVLDSVMYHRLSTRDYLTSAAAGAEDMMRGFTRWCAAHPRGAESCEALLKKIPGEATPQAIADYVAVLAHAASRGKLVSGAESWPVTPDDLARMFVSTYGYKDLPSALSFMAQSLADMRFQEAATTRDPSGYPQFVLRCADWYDGTLENFPQWVSAWKASNAEAPLLRTSPAHWNWMRDCLGTGIVRPALPEPMPESTPALIVSFRRDGATPWAWAERLAGDLGAPLVTYNGWGHGAYDTTLPTQAAECVAGFVDAFLIDAAHTGYPRPVCQGATAT